MKKDKQRKLNYKYKHWYLRVINVDPESNYRDDIETLMVIVDEFSKKSNYSHVKLMQKPDVHNRGGYCLHFDCREKDRMEIIHFLYSKGFMGVI